MPSVHNHWSIALCTTMYRIAENFQRRKLSRISWFCGYMQKFSPQNLERGIYWHGKSKQSVKAKIVFSPIREIFLPQKFPTIRYSHQIWEFGNLITTICTCIQCTCIVMCPKYMLQTLPLLLVLHVVHRLPSLFK